MMLTAATALIALAYMIGPEPQSGSMAVSATPVKAEAKKGAKVKTEKAMFGAGCFWGVEATFRKVPGVVDAAVGYSGGAVPNPTYKDVCTDRTGHAEVIYLEYDPAKVSYRDLLKVFWDSHDPTTLNRQGPDVGSQYRSAVFYYTPAQKDAAEADIKKLNESKRFKRPIVTSLEPAATFWRAEDYHQRYLEKRGLDTCHL